MNRIKTVIISVLCMSCTTGLHAIEASINTAVFYTEQDAYIEIYTRILARSVQFASLPDNEAALHAEIEMLIVFQRDGQPVMADKYLVESPATIKPADFWDMKRYQLKPGRYTLEMTFVDGLKVADSLHIQQEIDIAESNDSYKPSGVLLLAEVDTNAVGLPFNKGGFNFEPLMYHHVNAGQSQFYFYHELYHTGSLSSSDKYLKYYITSADEESRITSRPGYKRIKKDKEVVLQALDVSSLATGNYILRFEIFDRTNQMLDAYSKRFSVYHPLVDLRMQYGRDEMYETSFIQILDEDELEYGIKAIFPLVGNNMTETINLILAQDDVLTKRYFLYNFWHNLSPESPRTAYDSYMEIARAVDLEFSNNVGHGFETDRGYYFLKYGRPDDIVSVEEEPSAPPYEIWIYNYLEPTQQTNVKFLFYNPSLAGNDYILLHSTARGEVNNPNWEFDLYRDAFDNYDDDSFNKNAKRYFTDF